MSFNQIGIRALGSYTPPKKVSNAELAKFLDTSDEWIVSHTGIKNRHIAEEEVTTSDLALEAVNDLLSRNAVTKEEIGGIIVATASQDYKGFPSTACLLQHKLGLTTIPAFDLAAGCTGFIYGLALARSLVATQSLQSVLVVGSEKLSAIVDWTDRNTAVLFGDGAGCALVGESSHGVIIDSVLHAQGDGFDYLLLDRATSKLQMNGKAVYNFAVKVLSATLEELLERNNLTLEQIDWIVPHQANERIIKAAARRLKIEESKFFMNIAEYANTSAASIPIALREMEASNLLKAGQVLLTVGFGAGLTYGGNLIRV
ncbi:MAG: beta-ketoacyl-ACP synthase III [Sphaerochaetaceae bacterium]